MSDIQFGPLTADDASFLALSMLLVCHPPAAPFPFGRVLDILQAIRMQQTYAALKDGRLLGAVIWKECSVATARAAIAQRRMPKDDEFESTGPVIATMAFAAQSVEVGAALSKAFAEEQRGRAILYERPCPGSANPAVFKWVDKTGRRMGNDI